MRRGLGLGLAISIGLGTVAALPDQSGQAVELRGQVYFDHPPALLDASTTQRQTATSSAVHYFTLSVPADAGEPLQRVEIAQRDSSNSVKLIRYEADETRAFLGTRRDRQSELTLGETTYDRDSQTISVSFDPPVPPGETVTIGLRPVRNPLQDGIYLFGVTAFPAGENPSGQFLGYGRLTFDKPDSPFFF
ncbi:DUF2808 domain-containing protein [Phormidium tenue FACHB-886]|nr:DUF2808 domain-containing protein [Phormidium tenue FACHB-886]